MRARSVSLVSLPFCVFASEWPQCFDISPTATLCNGLIAQISFGAIRCTFVPGKNEYRRFRRSRGWVSFRGSAAEPRFWRIPLQIFFFPGAALWSMRPGQSKEKPIRKKTIEMNLREARFAGETVKLQLHST